MQFDYCTICSTNIEHHRNSCSIILSYERMNSNSYVIILIIVHLSTILYT
nr:MAG TPA_asm: hypothetical protein [Caudoviricetes sp.]